MKSVKLFKTIAGKVKTRVACAIVLITCIAESNDTQIASHGDSRFDGFLNSSKLQNTGLSEQGAFVGDIEIPRNRIVNGDSVEVWGAYHGRITCKICDLQPGDIELRGVDKYVWATQQFCQKQKDKEQAEIKARWKAKAEERAERERLAKEEAARRDAQRIARKNEEDARREAERITREQAEAEERAKQLVGDIEIPRNRIVNGDSIKIFDNHYGNVTCKLSELQPGDVNSFGCPTEQLHRKMSEKLRAKESEYAQKTIADLEEETQQIAAELRQQIPAIAEKIKSDQPLIDINSSGVLDFNWDDIREWRIVSL